MQAKGASEELLKQVEDEFYESRHSRYVPTPATLPPLFAFLTLSRKLFSIHGFRSALTRFEFLVRVILRHKQKYSGPVIPLQPPDKLENESASAL